MPVRRQAPDLIVSNALVRTLDGADSIAEAVAAKDGKIVAVGSNDEVLDLRDRETTVVNARRRTVLPGFIDGHTHLASAAIQRVLLIDYMDLDPRDIAGVLAPVRERAQSLPKGTWIRGDGLMESYLAEKRFPTRWEVDAVAPDHPVILVSIGKHMLVANSLALRLAGIDRQTEDPPGGKLDRDDAGDVIGVLRERGKLRLDPVRPDNVIPRYTVEERARALKGAFQHLHENGITSVHDIVPDPEEVRAYQYLQERDELALRVQMLIRGIESHTPLEHVITLGLKQGLGDEWLKFGGIKMSVDGACAWRNAATYDAYPGEPDNCGIVRIPQDELDEKVTACHLAGLRVAIHAIGQRAVDMALQAIEKGFEARPQPGHRHRIEHAYLPAPAGQLERMNRLGIIASPQPSFIYGFGDAWIDIWGKEQLEAVMPMRTLLDLGLKVMGSTDYPCVPVSPMLTVKSAVTRRTRAGEVLGAKEAIGVHEALRLQTRGAAYGGYEERIKGSIELGKLADFVVLSEDPFAVPAEELDRIQVDATILGGNLVYERQQATAVV